MTPRRQRSETARARGVRALTVGAALALALSSCASIDVSMFGTPSASSTATPDDTATSAATADPTSAAADAPPASAAPATTAAADCSDATITVSTAAELTDALKDPQPGAVIRVTKGTYQGEFVATGDGTADKPIALCGEDGSVLDDGQTESGYVLHLDNVSHWIVAGLTVQNGQKGVVADGTTDSVIENLTVQHIGDEGIHLRDFSTDDLVVDNTVSHTGLHDEKYGEGIYIGTAESNWCEISNCKPDRSDRNRVVDNTISRTSAESVDIKEGTSDGLLQGNTFDGTGMDEDGGDSWVDVKGDGWTIEGNTGTNSPNDGFQTHEILPGWGTGNTFENNTADVDGPGYGYSLTPALKNVVACDNTATHAGEGVSNEPCSTP